MFALVAAIAVWAPLAAPADSVHAARARVQVRIVARPARDVTPPFVFRVVGRLLDSRRHRPLAGRSCTGVVALALKVHQRPLDIEAAKVDRRCGFALTLRARRRTRMIGRARRLQIAGLYLNGAASAPVDVISVAIR